VGHTEHQAIPVDHLASLLASSLDPAVAVRLANDEVTIVGGNELFATLVGHSLHDVMRRRLSTVMPPAVVEAVEIALSDGGGEPLLLVSDEEPALLNQTSVSVRMARTESSGGQRFALLTVQAVRPATDGGAHKSILDTISTPVVAAMSDYGIVYANAASAEFLGRSSAALLGTDIRRVATADDWGRLAQLFNDPTAEAVTIELDHRSGQRRVARVSVNRIGDLVTLTLEDRTGERAHEERLAQFNALDPLTGLANRAGLASHIDRLAAEDNDRVLTLAFLDLDNFKTINDALGHDQGDLVLQTVGQRLENAVGSFGLVARLGGDEFVIACTTAPDVGSAELEHLVTQPFKEPVALGDKAFNITASVGIAAAHSTGDANADQILKAADLAMYEAKRRGKNTVHVYDSSLEHRATERLEIESDLRRALERDEFVVHYQPIMDVITGRPTGAEALVRWMHPERGMVPPDQFIPIAEQTGLIGPIGALVLETAVAQMSHWNQQHLTRRGLSISVNLSGLQLTDPNLERTVHAALSRSGLDPAKLTLEITESTLMAEADSTMALLGRLADLGISIAIDDFGTGYSSLAYLKSLPADILKIDRAFIDGLGISPKDTALVTGIVGLASALNFKIVAEGVENDRQLRELRRLGCESSQGFFHSKPVPASEFEEWIRGRQRSSGAPDGADQLFGERVAGIEAASDPIAPLTSNVTPIRAASESA
jgi:diguanylate cyclase (GGDEF)-like protein